MSTTNDLEAFARAFLAADFDEARKLCDKIDWAKAATAARAERLDAMTALSMSAELFDYLGKGPAAIVQLSGIRDAAEARLRALVDDRKNVSRSKEERRVLKRWISLLLQVATTDYRSMRLDDALRRCRLCEAAVPKVQLIPDYPCYGTLARIHYTIGLIYRERFRYHTAKQSFSRAIEFAWESIRRKSDLASGTPVQSRWADLTIARALGLGLGFVYHADGQPDLALPVLLSAKNLLLRLKEPLLSTYVDVLYLDARLSMYASDPSIVNESIDAMKKCYEVFVDHEHGLYRARTAYFLALAYTQRARPDESRPLTLQGKEDLAEADRYAIELEEYGRTTGDNRAHLYSMLFGSRIERKRDNLERAVKLATDAIDSGGDAHDRIHTGLLIARAEAAVRLGKLDMAIGDFSSALGLTSENLRSRAICLLRLTQIHASLGHSKVAADFFEAWTPIKPHITSAWIERLERAAQLALENVSQDFIVRLTDDKLAPGELEQQLRKFLVQWAARRTKTDTDAARLLGVSRQTLLNWRGSRRQ